MKPSEKCKSAGLKSLADFIAENFCGSQRAFARANNVLPQQVTQWINKRFVVSGGEMYSHRRTLNCHNIKDEKL